MLARPLYSLPQPVFVEGATPQANPAVIAAYAHRIQNLFSDVPGLRLDDDDRPEPTVIGFAADARALFEKWEARLNQERRQLGSDDDDEGGLYLGWLSKLAGHTARIAAVLHTAERGATAREPPRPRSIRRR